MEEQLVTFKTAKLAKEKGFDIPVDSFYSVYSNNDFIIDNSYLRKYNKFDNQEYIKTKNWNLTKDFTSAPTLSLLQKWLRDVHNIHVNVSYGLTFTFKINGDLKGTDYIEYSDQEKYWRRTYEKALEKGLKVALKLIKN